MQHIYAASQEPHGFGNAWALSRLSRIELPGKSVARCIFARAYDDPISKNPIATDKYMIKFIIFMRNFYATAV
jgi:hypothetical protein